MSAMPRTTTRLIGASLLLATITLGGPPVAAQPFPPPGLSSHPNAAVQEHMRRGSDAMSRGHWEAAVEAYTKALRTDPRLVEAQTNMGMAHYFHRNIPAAVSALEQALEMQPDRIDAAHGLGLALYDGGDLDGAIEAFRTATRLNAQAYYNLGNALEQRGDIEGARDAYRHYLETHPSGAEAAVLRKALESGASPTPAAGSAQDHFQRGVDLLARNDAAAAGSAFLTAMRLKPNYVEACNMLGQAFRLQGKLSEAMGGYMMALRLDPNFGVVHRNLGQAFEETGNPQAAAQAYDRYLVLVPGADDAAEIRDKIAVLRRQPR